MANEELAGRCPGEHERKALELVVVARRRDTLAARLNDFLRGLRDDPDAHIGDAVVILELLKERFGGSVEK